jgi:hypothetical protein
MAEIIKSKTQQEIIDWATPVSLDLSAHDTFDDMEHEKLIQTFYSGNAPKTSSGLVMTIEDAELLAYEYAKRLESLKNKKV